MARLLQSDVVISRTAAANTWTGTVSPPSNNIRMAATISRWATSSFVWSSYLFTLDLIQVAHCHGGDQGETDGDGGGQPVTAVVKPVAI
jgi:hypothetical protein